MLKAKGLRDGRRRRGRLRAEPRVDQRALDFLVEAIGKAGYEPGGNVFIAIDAAASEFFEKGAYQLEGKKLSTQPRSSTSGKGS